MGRLTSAEYAKTHGAAAAAQLHKEREARTAKINRRIAEGQAMRTLKPMDAASGSRLVNSFIDNRKPLQAEAHHTPKGGFSRFDKVNLRYRPATAFGRAKYWTTNGWEANSLLNRHRVSDWGDVLSYTKPYRSSQPEHVPSKPYSTEDKFLLSVLKQTGGHSRDYQNDQILKGIKHDARVDSYASRHPLTTALKMSQRNKYRPYGNGFFQR